MIQKTYLIQMTKEIKDIDHTSLKNEKLRNLKLFYLKFWDIPKLFLPTVTRYPVFNINHNTG